MRTPEEILNKKGGFYIDDEFSQRCYAEDDVIEAMSDYAKQEAEAFAEWLGKNCHYIGSNMWYYEMAKLKVIDLYILFKTEKKDGK
jgi:hypothetical protein